MSFSSKELREKRANIATQMRELVTKAGAEGRTLNDEERQKFNRMEKDESDLKSRIDDIEKVDRIQGDIAARAMDQEDRHDHLARKKDLPSRQDCRMAMNAWALGPKRAGKRLKEAAEKCGVDIYQSEMQITMPGEMRAPSTVHTQTANTTFSTAIAQEFANQLETALAAFGGARENSTVVRTDNGAAMVFPIADDSTSVALIVNEATGTTQHNPPFYSRTISTFTYRSMFTATREFIQDFAFNFAAFAGEHLGIRLARGTNEHFTVGSGSGQPWGYVTDATTVTQATNGTANISTTNLLRLVHNLDPAYRNMPRAMFSFHDSTLRIVKSLLDTQNRPLWLPGVASGEPDTLLGHSYFVNQAMATDTTADGGVKVVAFGDMSKHIIRDVPGMTIQRLDERYAEQGMVAWLLFSRHGSRTIGSTHTEQSSYPIQSLLTATT